MNEECAMNNMASTPETVEKHTAKNFAFIYFQKKDLAKPHFLYQLNIFKTAL